MMLSAESFNVLLVILYEIVSCCSCERGALWIAIIHL